MLTQDLILEKLLANTLVMSRTAQTGELNAKGREGKPARLLTSEGLKQAVVLSTAVVSGILVASTEGADRNANQILTLIRLEKLFYEALTMGTLATYTPETRYRKFPTGRNYGLPPEKIFKAMHATKPNPGFLVKLAEPAGAFRLRHYDAIGLAAWVEYEIDMRIHPYPDACGRMARAFSAWTLLWNDAPLPYYRDRTAYYAAMNESWESFLAYYRTCFPGG